MKKVFVSMPMNGFSNEAIARNFDLAKVRLEMLIPHDVEIIKSWNMKDAEDPIELLAKSISLLAEADYVYFASGWEKARGCRIEHAVAVAYDKKCLYDQPALMGGETE